MPSERSATSSRQGTPRKSRDGDGRESAGGGSTNRGGEVKAYHSRMQFFQDELKRLERDEKERNDKITKPSAKPYTPYIFNSLYPYSDTRAFSYAVNQGDAVRHTPISRRTAGGPCDPWVSHAMDTRDIGVPVKTTPLEPHKPARTPRNASQTSQRSARSSATQGSSRRSHHEGESSEDRPASIYPIIAFTQPKEFSERELNHNDVPKIRETVCKKYSPDGIKKDDDYRLTTDEFHRRGLDRMSEYTPVSRRTMRAAYFAYLQNSPGSTMAVRECVHKEDEEEKERKRNKSRQNTTKEDSERGESNANGTSEKAGSVHDEPEKKNEKEEAKNADGNSKKKKNTDSKHKTKEREKPLHDEYATSEVKQKNKDKTEDDAPKEKVANAVEKKQEPPKTKENDDKPVKEEKAVEKANESSSSEAEENDEVGVKSPGRQRKILKGRQLRRKKGAVQK